MKNAGKSAGSRIDPTAILKAGTAGTLNASPTRLATLSESDLVDQRMTSPSPMSMVVCREVA